MTAGHRLSRIVDVLASQDEGLVSEDHKGTSLDSSRIMAASGLIALLRPAALSVLPGTKLPAEARRGELRGAEFAQEGATM